MSQPEQQGFWHHCCHHDPAACVAGQLEDIRAQLGRIEKNTETIMTEDASLQASAADLEQDATNLAAALTTIEAALTAALSDAVQPSTVTLIQNAQAALDSVTATAQSDASATAPAAPASDTPPAS